MEAKRTDTQNDRPAVKVDWNRFAVLVGKIVDKVIFRRKADMEEDLDIRLFGVPTGGSIVALKLHGRLQNKGLHVKLLDEFVSPKEMGERVIVVDDIADTGKTIKPYAEQGADCYVLHKSHKFVEDRKCGKENDVLSWVYGAEIAEGWIWYPWEHSGAPEDAVIRLLEYIGEDPKREGLTCTPERVLKAWRQMTSGYSVDCVDVLKSAVFSEVGKFTKYDEMILLQGVPFYSTCEHHMMPFFGKVHVGYIPGENGKVVGVSKLARVVEAHARRLQIQERMTESIANDIMTALSPSGVAVVVEGQHLCMQARGVQKSGSVMTTSSMLGVFRENAETRSEFLRLIGR